jgi:acyl-CoA thioester hydrolase
MAEEKTSQYHSHPVRVYYEDTDAAGIVYYANYLKYAERARTELLRTLGLENASLMENSGLAFAVRHCSIDYIKAARLDDALYVATFVIDLAGASLTMQQDVYRAGDVLVSLEVRLACIDVASGRAKRLPAPVRDAFAGYLSTS